MRSRIPIYSRAWQLFLLVLIALCPATGFSGSTEFYSVRTRFLAEQSFQIWRNVSTSQIHNTLSSGPAVGGLRHSKARAAVRQEALATYLSQVVPAMKISPQVAHIPKEHPIAVTSEESGDSRDQNWIRYYDKAKTTLRPNVKYQWKSNVSREGAEITLSKGHVDTLQANFDVVMWYRRELGAKCPGREHAGAKHLRLFLDCIIADLLDGMPASPRFSIQKGTVTIPDWELDERNLREQLVMAYRYFVAKYLTYSEYDEFASADREALMSLMKIGYLMGCRLEYQWLDEHDVRLDRSTGETRWKKAVASALAVLDLKGREQEMGREQRLLSPARYEQPCVIRIPPPKPPPKPKPKPAPKPPPPADTKIEIIVHPKR